MQYQSFLIKYAEIGTKGKNRYIFEDALMHQIREHLKKVEGEFAVQKEQGRIYVNAKSEYDYDEVVDALQHVFGVTAICPMLQIEKCDYPELRRQVLAFVQQEHPEEQQTAQGAGSDLPPPHDLQDADFFCFGLGYEHDAVLRSRR